DRADPLPARLHQVLGAVDEADVALGVDDGDVARAQPTVVGEGLAGPRVVVVVGRDPRPTRLELARRLAVPRRLLAGLRIDDAEVDAGSAETLAGPQVGQLVVGPALQRRFDVAH